MLRSLFKSFKGGAPGTGEGARAQPQRDAGAQAPAATPLVQPAAPAVAATPAAAAPAAGSSEAISLARTHLARDPGQFEARFALAQQLAVAGLHAEAEPLLRHCVRERPAWHASLQLLGFCLRAQGRVREAIEYGRLAVAVAPLDAHSALLLAQQLFLDGQYAEAFLHFRARAPRRPAWADTLPRWQGEPLAGKRLFVWQDWGGLGDELMFARYVPLLLERDAPAQLHWSVLEANRRLLGALSGVTQAFSRIDALAVDVHIPLLDLPCVFGTDWGKVPAPARYLRADPADTARWAQRLAPLPGLKIGLCWSSGHWNSDPEFERDRRARSIALAQLAHWSRIPGISLVSLQKGKDAREWEEARRGGALIHDFEADLTDMGQSAALLENLDLLVSVDTSVPHLAAALGKPVLLLAARNIGLFWGPEEKVGQRTPWYPTMRLLRQQAAGEWDAEIAQAGALLEAYARTGRVDLFGS
jgi:hypothetical protein